MTTEEKLTKTVTPQVLEDFYNDKILPYLNGMGNPTGSIISFMGNNAPFGYLKCDGTVYNISSYPDLANFFKTEFGSKNNFGGNGTTTFAVPDLRGEFLRGTGTNSHTNMGSGANVGVHQDGTEHNRQYIDGTNAYTYYDNSQGNTPIGQDSFISLSSSFNLKATTAKTTTSKQNELFTSRPTNTSVLYCIKY